MKEIPDHLCGWDCETVQTDICPYRLEQLKECEPDLAEAKKELLESQATCAAMRQVFENLLLVCVESNHRCQPCPDKISQIQEALNSAQPKDLGSNE